MRNSVSFGDFYDVKSSAVILPCVDREIEIHCAAFSCIAIKSSDAIIKFYVASVHLDRSCLRLVFL